MVNRVLLTDVNNFDPIPGIFDPRQIIFCCPEIFSWFEFAADWNRLPIPRGRGGHRIRCCSYLLNSSPFNNLFLFFRSSDRPETVDPLFSWFTRELSKHRKVGS